MIAGAEPGGGTEAVATSGAAEPGTDSPPQGPASGPDSSDDGGPSGGGPDNGGDNGREGPAGSGRRSRKSAGSFLRELPVLVLIALGLALLIKAFLLQAFYIPSGSDEQTLMIGDRVLVNKLVYDFRNPRRGEIVVFNGEGTGFPAEIAVAPPSNILQRAARDVQGLLGLGTPSEKDFIKRIIGVPGDTVACCDAQHRVTVNGVPLDEPYVYLGAGSEGAAPAQEQDSFAAVTVPAGMVFVAGDHRNDSQDSRRVGTIPISKVIGRAIVVVWPVGRFGTLPVPRTFSKVHSASGRGALTPSSTLAQVPAVPGDPSLVLGAALTAPFAALRMRRRRRRRLGLSGGRRRFGRHQALGRRPSPPG